MHRPYTYSNTLGHPRNGIFYWITYLLARCVPKMLVTKHRRLLIFVSVFLDPLICDRTSGTEIKRFAAYVISCVVSGIKKVKCTLVQVLRLCTSRTAHRGSRGITLLFLDHGNRRVEGSASRPDCSLPPGKTRYSLYRRLDGSQGRSGQMRKISPSTGIRSRTVEPVASRYTDYAIGPTVSGIVM